MRSSSGQAQGEAHLGRADIVEIAAQLVVRLRIARTDAAELEAAQVGAADEEAVRQVHVLAEDAANVAGAAAQADDHVRDDRVVVLGAQLMADEAVVAAQARHILVEAEIVALGRQEALVAAVVGEGLADQRGRPLTLLVLDEHRRVIVDVVDLVGAQRVAHGMAQILGQRIAQAQRTAEAGLVIGRLVLEVGARAEQVERRRRDRG